MSTTQTKQSSTGTGAATSSSTGASTPSPSTPQPPGSVSITGVQNPGLAASGVPSPKKHGMQDKITERLAGLQDYMPQDTSLTINGQSFTVSGLVQVFQTMANLFTALDSAQQQSKVQITQLKQQINGELPAVAALIAGVDNYLRSYFGKGNPVLANFGIASGARTQPKSVTLAKAAATATLTRKARHTLGKKQKRQITGGQATVSITGPGGAVIAGSTPSASSPSVPGTTANNGVPSSKLVRSE